MKTKLAPLPTIGQIREATREESPYFFTRDTLRFFGQTMRSFRVIRGGSGAVYIAAPSYWTDRQTGRPKLMGFTLRKFTGTDLESVEIPDQYERSMELVRLYLQQNG